MVGTDTMKSLFMCCVSSFTVSLNTVYEALLTFQGFNLTTKSIVRQSQVSLMNSLRGLNISQSYEKFSKGGNVFNYVM